MDVPNNRARGYSCNNPDYKRDNFMMDYWAYAVPLLIVAPFSRNKLLAVIFMLAYKWFVPDYWQLWLTLYFVSLITVESTSG